MELQLYHEHIVIGGEMILLEPMLTEELIPAIPAPTEDPVMLANLSARVQRLEERVTELENTWWRRFKNWLKTIIS